MKPSIIMLFVALLWGSSTHHLFAQNDVPKKGFDKKRLFVDGNIGFNFSNNSAYAQVSPVLGYWITQRLAAGAGPSFEYYKYGTYSTTNYGGRLFTRFYPLRSLFAHAEYEIVNYKDYYTNTRKTQSRLPIGAGYSQSVGGAAYINGMVLYDVLYKANSSAPFNDYIAGGWIFRVGVTMGLGGGGSWSPNF
jgi:hypothetical protein